ncbi:NitT/TauT family transport system permease protein [Rhodoligotrophos appendicifer]|uniref:ABC transporter permease n=1 Tax=Rhodoligotrophos appendicifer TaxID=987056 RepID=UPI001186D82B|nr:ABC transporter permease [Rhodoligotrophos appendicifer]
MESGSKLLVAQVAILVGVLGFWEILADAGIIDVVWLSSPTLIAAAFWKSVLANEITYHAYVTMQEAMAGLAVGAVVGIGLGLLLGVSRFVGAALEPFIIALNSLPRVALAPLIIMFVGIGFASKFLLAFSLVVVPMMINTYEGIKSVEPVLLNVMKVFRANRLQVFTKVLLPNCVPWIFSGLRVSISFAVIGAIVGELISSRAGIGFMIDTAAGNFDATGMLMPLFVLMILTFALDRLVLRISRSLLRWREGAH